MRTAARNPSELLREAGLRKTKPRLAVLHTLAEASRPVSIKELTGLLPASLHIDTVTLYRMMDSFVKLNVISKVELGRAHAMFELKNSDHHHIVCQECQRVEDFEDIEHLSLAKRALKHSKNFSRLTGHSFELYGLCKSCAA